MFIHFYTYDVLNIYIRLQKNSFIIKLHVMFSGINEWLYMLNFFVHINITT